MHKECSLLTKVATSKINFPVNDYCVTGNNGVEYKFVVAFIIEILKYISKYLELHQTIMHCQILIRQLFKVNLCPY